MNDKDSKADMIFVLVITALLIAFLLVVVALA